MDRAAAEEKKRKADAFAAAADAKRKRPSSLSGEHFTDPKRVKIEADSTTSTSASFLAAFDFTSLPATLITELIVANLEAFTEPALIALVQAYRQSRGITTPEAVPSITAPVGPALKSTPEHRVQPTDQPPTPPAVAVVKDEPVDPLQMDIDEEELEYEPDKLNMEV